MAESSELIYKVDDRPPWGALFLLASQHMFVPISYSVFAVVVVREAGGSHLDIKRVITMALIAGAIGVVLQALKRGPIGSGYLAAQISSAIYMPASLAAGAMGGPSLIWGMTVIAGLFEVVLSRIIAHLRAVFPPVVCGLVITMVGFSLVNLAMESFLGMGRAEHIFEMRELAVSSLTLTCLVVLSVWGKSWLRLYSILISLIIGDIVALALGLLSSEALAEIADVPWLAMPEIGHHGFAFDQRILAPFLVAGLAAAVKASSLVITSQRLNDPQWREPDMKNVSRGVLADALGTVAAGLLGTIGTNPSPTSVSLTTTTGAASRYIGFATGALVLAAAFMPKVTTIISLLPVPVTGAVLVYAVCIISGAGLRLIFTGEWDLRRTFVVGLSFLLGLSVEVNPHLYDQLPDWAQLVFHSPITVSALTAIGLNLLFGLGQTKQT